VDAFDAKQGHGSTSLPPQAAVAARHKAGRIRLPPAKSEYLIARWMVAGFVVADGVTIQGGINLVGCSGKNLPKSKEDPEGDRSVL